MSLHLFKPQIASLSSFGYVRSLQAVKVLQGRHKGVSAKEHFSVLGLERQVCTRWARFSLRKFLALLGVCPFLLLAADDSFTGAHP